MAMKLSPFSVVLYLWRWRKTRCGYAHNALDGGFREYLRKC